MKDITFKKVLICLHSLVFLTAIVMVITGFISINNFIEGGTNNFLAAAVAWFGGLILGRYSLVGIFAAAQLKVEDKS